MSLNLREFGPHSAGTPWVLLHGWGFDGSVLESLARRLAADRHVLVADLPGWGDSSAIGRSTDPHDLAGAILGAVPRPARWLGWSLGGLVALAAATREPAAVAAVDLLAATPRFCADTDWPGMDPVELQQFVEAVRVDPRAAHRRFLAFQLAGSENARSTMRALRAHAGQDDLPAPSVLQDGLEMLRIADLRASTGALSCPVRAVLGSADPLVPAAVAEPLARLGVDVRRIDGAGHALFLSHPQAVLAALME